MTESKNSFINITEIAGNYPVNIIKYMCIAICQIPKSLIKLATLLSAESKCGNAIKTQLKSLGKKA